MAPGNEAGPPGGPHWSCHSCARSKGQSRSPADSHGRSISLAISCSSLARPARTHPVNVPDMDEVPGQAGLAGGYDTAGTRGGLTPMQDTKPRRAARRLSRPSAGQIPSAWTHAWSDTCWPRAGHGRRAQLPDDAGAKAGRTLV